MICRKHLSLARTTYILLVLSILVCSLSLLLGFWSSLCPHLLSCEVVNTKISGYVATVRQLVGVALALLLTAALLEFIFCGLCTQNFLDNHRAALTRVKSVIDLLLFAAFLVFIFSVLLWSVYVDSTAVSYMLSGMLTYLVIQVFLLYLFRHGRAVANYTFRLDFHFGKNKTFEEVDARTYPRLKRISNVSSDDGTLLGTLDGKSTLDSISVTRSRRCVAMIHHTEDRLKSLTDTQTSITTVDIPVTTETYDIEDNADILVGKDRNSSNKVEEGEPMKAQTKKVKKEEDAVHKSKS